MAAPNRLLSLAGLEVKDVGINPVRIAFHIATAKVGVSDTQKAAVVPTNTLRIDVLWLICMWCIGSSSSVASGLLLFTFLWLLFPKLTILEQRFYNYGMCN